MEKVNFCKIGALAVLFLGVVSASPLLEAEDAITVPSIQFRSKADQDVCTGYQVRGHLFVTLARCLGTEPSDINQLRELDVIGQGVQKVQAFALRSAGSESSGDIAVVMYSGAPSKEVAVDSNGLFEKFGLAPKERFERQDAAAGAAFADVSMRLVSAALALVGSLVLMK